MKRIVKEPRIRRREIMDAAKKLFEKKGYENTSVEVIIKKAGIAKGTFYYYFKTKKDILRAIVEQIGSEIEGYFNSIVAMKNVTAIKKLELMIRGPEKKAIIKSPVMDIIHKAENRELQEQLNIQCIKTIAPLIVKVIEQGNKEGIFNTVISIESIQLILAGSQFMLDSGLFDWTSKQRLAFLNELQRMFEKEIGAKSGTLSFISKE